MARYTYYKVDDANPPYCVIQNHGDNPEFTNTTVVETETEAISECARLNAAESNRANGERAVELLKELIDWANYGGPTRTWLLRVEAFLKEVDDATVSD